MEQITRWTYEKTNNAVNSKKRLALIILNYLTLGLILGITIFTFTVKEAPLWIQIVCLGFFIFLSLVTHYSLGKSYYYNPLHYVFKSRLAHDKNSARQKLFSSIYWCPERLDILRDYNDLDYFFSVYNLRAVALKDDYKIVVRLTSKKLKVKIYDLTKAKPLINKYSKELVYSDDYMHNIYLEALELLKNSRA